MATGSPARACARAGDPPRKMSLVACIIRWPCTTRSPWFRNPTASQMAFQHGPGRLLDLEEQRVPVSLVAFCSASWVAGSGRSPAGTQPACATGGVLARASAPRADHGRRRWRAPWRSQPSPVHYQRSTTPPVAADQRRLAELTGSEPAVPPVFAPVSAVVSAVIAAVVPASHSVGDDSSGGDDGGGPADGAEDPAASCSSCS